MRVIINTETRALLWFAMTNGLAHFYFTMLPYLIYEGLKINQVTTTLSLSLICVWLYGVRTKSSMILILIIPLCWLLTSGIIIGDLPQLHQPYAEEAINLNSTESLTLSDRLNWVDTLLSGLCMVAYLASGLMWLVVADGKNTDQSNLSRIECHEVNHHESPPHGWSGVVIAYWAIASPMSIHYWSRWSFIPETLTAVNDQIVWIKALWFLSFMIIVLSTSVLLFRLSPPALLFLEGFQLATVDRSWRRKAWMVSLIGILLMTTALFDV